LGETSTDFATAALVRSAVHHYVALDYSRKSKALMNFVALDPRSRDHHEKSGREERKKLVE
jgi:hypothetical protein